uniref:Uncharacterized protein n=1 Tax=Romanomermis culicivorax TaxID=13658 RepID=A0A915HJP5_ROMCU
MGIWVLPKEKRFPSRVLLMHHDAHQDQLMTDAHTYASDGVTIIFTKCKQKLGETKGQEKENVDKNEGIN